MNFAIIASYDRRNEMMEYAHRLRMAGHGIVSRWVLRGDDELDRTFESIDPFEQDDVFAEIAEDDKKDICEGNADGCAHAALVFTEPQVTRRSRGGRHCELAWAIEHIPTVVIIGPRENIFCHLDDILQYPDFDTFFQKYIPGATEHEDDLNETNHEVKLAAQQAVKCGLACAPASQYEIIEMIERNKRICEAGGLGAK